MNYIHPEDFEWYDDLHKENFNNGNCKVINSFCDPIKDDQNYQFANTHYLNQGTSESINSIYSTEEKCYTTLGENGLKCSDKTSLEEVKCSNTNYSGTTLNCLYRDEQFLGFDDVEHSTGGHHNSSKEEILGNNNSNALSSNNLEAFKTNNFHDNAPLNVETISLIRNSIIGEYDSPDSFASINYRPNENEQIVPISNYVSLDENENHEPPFKFSNQDVAIFNDENTVLNNDTRHSPNIIEDSVNFVSNTNEANDEGLLGIQSSFYDDIYAFTPGGQCYKLMKRNYSYSETKVATEENRSEAAAVLNNCKKLRQIQGGIFIPETLSYNKEEDFNNWLREEKNKIISLFENFNIKLNIKDLKIERELIKLDRNLKQYSLSSIHDSKEILELVEKTDIDLNNLVVTPQVYETVSKVMKNCKGPLRVKARKVLMKLKSVLALPKGIRAEKYLNDMLSKTNASKLKLDAPVESIVHLLTFL